MVTKIEGCVRTLYLLALTFTNIFLFLIIPGWLLSPTFLASQNQWDDSIFGAAVMVLFVAASFAVTISYFMFFRHLKMPLETFRFLYMSSLFTTFSWICCHISFMLILNFTNESMFHPGYGIVLFMMCYFSCTLAFILSSILLRGGINERKRKQRMQNTAPKVISTDILMFPNNNNQQQRIYKADNNIVICRMEEADELPSKIELPD